MYYVKIFELYNRDVNDLNVFFRLLIVDPDIFNPVYDVQSLDRPAKNRVLVVQPGLLIVSLPIDMRESNLRSSPL